MMAMGLFGVVFGSIGYLLIAAIDARRDAMVLSQSVLLAKKYMNKIQQILEEESKEEDIAGFPSYRYRYEIKEEEKNLFENDLFEGNDALKEQFSNSISGNKSTVQKEDSVTAGIIKVLHYQVIVSHKSGLNYNLDYYRMLQ